MKKYLFYTWLLLCGACTLEPEGLHYEDVIQPTPSGFISLNNYDATDTIHLYNATSFNYNLGSDQGEIETVQVLLDDYIISGSSRSSSGKFSLDLYQLQRAPKKLKIQFVSGSNSGSLANKLGVEKFQLWREWTLAVDVSDPPIPVLTLSTQNGFMKVNWTGYTKPNFKNYGLEIIYNQGSSKYKTFTNSNQTSWIDSSYVGNYSASYRVTVSALQSRYSVTQYSSGTQQLKATYRAADSTVSLSWLKPKFPGAFKQYVITEGGQERVISNINDTTLSYQLQEVIFKKDASVNFSVKAKYPVYVSSSLYQIITNTAGASVLKPVPSVIYYNAPADQIISMGGGTTPYSPPYYARFYDNTMKKKDSLVIVSTSVNYHSASPYIYYNEVGYNLVQQNLLTKEIKKSTIAIPTGYRSGPSNVAGAANGKVYYGMITLSGSYNSLERIYDFSSNALFYNHSTSLVSTSSTIPLLNISGQGNYVRHYPSNNIYRANGTALDLIGTLPGTGSFSRFRDDNDNQILMQSGTTIAIVNTTNVTYVKTITPPSGYSYVMYDPGTHYALYAKANSEGMYLINIDTEQTKTIKVYTSSSISGYKLVKGFLFAEDGSYIKVL